MKFLDFIVILFLVSTSYKSLAQTDEPIAEKSKNDTITVSITMINNEMMPWVPLPEINILDYRIFKTPQDRAKFNRLRYNVLRVLPYSMFARNRYEQLQRDLAVTNSRRQKRLLMKAFEKEIKDMFNREIKNLTVSQGAILIKLIDRETGNSSYELVKQMKGSINAFVYQSAARIFGHNLKNKYDPQEDRDIESIIQSSYYYMYN